MIRTYKEVDRFTVGTIGAPGARTFFLQIRAGSLVLSASIEKSQVGAMGERLSYMLKEIRQINPLAPHRVLRRDSLPLDLPIEEEFRIGSIAIFYDEVEEMIQIDLRELGDFEVSSEEENGAFDESEGVEIIRLFISAEQALTFSDRAALVVAAGRQPCPFCALPIDPQGHLCARANGYRR